MEKEFKIFIAIIIAGLLIAFALNYKVEKKVETTDTIVIPTVAPKVTIEFKNQFMGSCIGGTATYAYCNCTYDTFVKTYGENELINEGLAYDKTNTLSDKLLDIAKACIQAN